MRQYCLIFCLLLITIGLKGQVTNIFVHSNFTGFPDTAAINNVYTNIGFSTVNITSGTVDSTLVIANYEVAYITEYYNYGTASTVFLTATQRQIVQQFVENGGHVVWIAESIDNYISSPVVPPVNSNAITTINNIYGENLSYGPFFNNGGMGSPNMPRIHPSTGPGGLSGQANVLSSGSYATLLNVPSANAIYTSDFYDNTNFFDACTHTTLALFPALPVATEGTILISSEIGLPFHATSVGPFGGSPFVYNTILDSSIAVLHFNLLTNVNMSLINSWLDPSTNLINGNCPPCVIALDSINNVSCNGTGDGAIFVSVIGGTGPYGYSWNNGATIEDISLLPSGGYNLTVTDSLGGCVATSMSYVVEEPAAISLAVNSINNITCNGTSDGSVFITTTGGIPSYHYNWSNGATISNITNLNGGAYSVTITDSNSCVITSGPYTITEPTVINVGVDSTKDMICNNASDGAVYLTTTGGVPAYTYNWSNGATTDDATGLIAGTHIVTITDANNCVVIDSITLSSVPAILVALDGIDSVSCNGQNDGGINIVTTLGTGNYSWIWDNGATTEDVTGLTANNYTVTVTDTQGCTITAGAYSVWEPAALVINLNKIDSISCNGLSDGAVNITTVGGTLGYNFVWSGGQNTENITGLNGSINTVTVTDANGCTTTSGPHVVNEPAVLELIIGATVPLEGCLGEAIGVLSATITGGVGIANYQWSNGATTAVNGGLNAGIYNLTATDLNGCLVTGVDSIQNPIRPTVNPFVGQALTKDTTIQVGDIIRVDAGNDQTANGVSYNWTEVTNLGAVNFSNSTAVSTTVNPQLTTSGTYVLLVTATSADGCIDTGSVRITVAIDDFVGLPTAFTPNGDGVNDFFRPVSLDKQFILEFKIYNRWGQVVFNNTNTDTQWDGMFNGIEQPSEVYIHLLRYKIPGQEEQTLRGEFTLIR